MDEVVLILEKSATRSLYPRPEQGGLEITLPSIEFKEWQRQNRPRKVRDNELQMWSMLAD